MHSGLFVGDSGAVKVVGLKKFGDVDHMGNVPAFP